MASFRAWRQLSGRPIIVGVFACLFILQALALAVYPAFAAKAGNSADQSVIVSTNEGLCDALGSDKVPTKGYHDHSGCCILCKASAHDASFADFAVTIGDAFHLASIANPSFLPFLADDSCKRPTGWASSWSSRAPPRV